MTSDGRNSRRGAAAVEAALVLPVLFLLTVGLIVGGVGVFNHQQVACQAREAARWAAVRGGDFQKEADRPSPTRQEIVEATVLPAAAGMDTAALAVDVQWVDKGTNAAEDWDAAPKDVRSITTPGGEYVSNTVRVTVTYRWEPGVFLPPLTLRGVCEVPMAR